LNSKGKDGKRTCMVIRPKVKGLSNGQEVPIIFGMDEIIQEMTMQIMHKEEDYPCGKEGR